MKGRILSGVQPTGNLHLGNYLGAIRNWVAMQADYDCLFCVVDMHAITVPQKPEALTQSIYENTAAYLAAGVDPQKSRIFVQSAVAEHAELAWVLNCHTPLGWLNRMTQFKEKAGKKRDNAPLGLYSYPVLMAADILLYHATHVPVGDDQRQHLELTRDVAGAFNRFVDKEFFPLPETVLMGEATRVMSLRDGKNKMSKSDPSDYSRINLTDDADVIAQKFKKAKSDSEPAISYDVEGRPEASNLISLYAALSGQSRDAVVAEYGDKGFATFKQALADLAVDKLAPMTSRMRDYMNDRSYLDEVLSNGADQAREIASTTMQDVKELIGFWKDPR